MVWTIGIILQGILVRRWSTKPEFQQGRWSPLCQAGVPKAPPDALQQKSLIDSVFRGAPAVHQVGAVSNSERESRPQLSLVIPCQGNTTTLPLWSGIPGVHHANDLSERLDA